MSGGIFDWSTTASNNDSADGDINWAEGQNAKTVNNSARQMMGRVAEILLDIGGQGTVGGTANAITLTLNSAFTGLKSGLICSLKPTADNTGAVTLNVNGIGAKSIRKFDVSGEVALASGDLQAGNFYSLIYDSSANSAAGAWICLNPTLASVTGPASATDGDIMVADGTTGRAIKDGGSKISDLMPKAGGTFTGAIVAPSVTSSAGNFVGSSSVAVISPSSAGGGIYLRPEGGASISGQAVLTSAGGMVVSGGVTSSQNFVGGANVVLAPNASGGNAYLRPNGAASSTGQTTVDSSGNMSVAGTLTVGGNAVLTTATDIGSFVAAVTFGDVGTIALVNVTGGTNPGVGGSIAGSNLKYTSVSNNNATSPVPSGTWRLMGNIAATGGSSGSTTVAQRTA